MFLPIQTIKKEISKRSFIITAVVTLFTARSTNHGYFVIHPSAE